MKDITKFVIFVSLAFINCEKEPKILSCLYGYDNCIGGVNNFESEEEYLDDLKERNCTVEDGHTNVVDHKRFILGCYDLFQQLSWMDGMPVVFNYPVEHLPSYDDFSIELSDGTLVTPDCTLLRPANEQNEMDTVLLLGQFGDGQLDTVRPATVTVIGDVQLVTDDGLVSAKGLTYNGNMNYMTSFIRMVSAKLWDVEHFPEDFIYPLWPLPSQIYPNHCSSLYENTTHVIRVIFNGGVTIDGIQPIMPNNSNVFRLTQDTNDHSLNYLGLADLGKTSGDDVDDPHDYSHDSDNHLDICLDFSTSPEYLENEIDLELLCDETLENSVLYPPKGKPFSCKNQKITLTSNNDKYLLSWELN